MVQKEIRVLVLTSIIPIQEIQHKKDENDIILLNGDSIEENYKSIIFKYGFVFPKSSRLLSLLSPKWKSYFNLSLKKNVIVKNKKILLFPIPIIPGHKLVNKVLSDLFFLFNKKKISLIINEYNPTIIHAHSVKSDGYLGYKIFKKYRIPYILTIREFSDKNILPEVIKNAKKIISINAIDKIKLEEQFNISAEFIPHGVPSIFFNDKKERADKILRFVTVCRLIPLKNIDKIINSLAKREEEFIFDIYGDGTEMEKIKDLIRINSLEGKVNLKGFVANTTMAELYPDYDVFIMPSKPEALGRVYFEAMASGIPVIAAKNTGIDGIIESGREGFLVDIDDGKSLNVCLQEIFDNPSVLFKMGINAKLKASEFHISNIITKNYEIYV